MSAPSFERVINALEACGCVPTSGPSGARRIQARCPAHADHDPSLSVRHDGTKTLIHCFAGCDPDDVVDALSLRWQDLFDDSYGVRRSERISELERRIEALERERGSA